MIAKFKGKCNKCGQEIGTGTEINWEKGKGAQHVTCPENSSLSENTIDISQGSGYGGQPFTVGQVLRKKRNDWPAEGKILVILQSSKKYYREDGLSFGVGDDEGYIYRAKCREATPKEAAPLLAQEADRIVVSDAKISLKKIIEQIQAGERPGGENVPAGDRLYGKPDLYGGGEWIVIGPEWIWYCQNNGSDGDNWSYNNVHTGGAGAIGWRVPFEQGLADKITGLCKILQPRKEEEEFNQKLAEHLEQGGMEY